MKKEKELNQTIDRRTYKILKTVPHWLENECGFTKFCFKCKYKETGVCRAERTEIRNWKEYRKKQWKK